MPSAIRSTWLSALTALPWCCIAPAAFAMSGAAVAGAGLAIQTATPALFVVSLGLLARALYVSLIQRRGRRWVRGLVLGTTPLVVALWCFRLGVWPL